MAKIFIEESSLEAIGNAIREKTGGTESLIVPDGMVSAIQGIETGNLSQPTQFTNVLAYADSFEINTRFSSSDSSSTAAANSIIAVTLDLNKLPNSKILQQNTNRIRFRGCSHVDSVFAQSSDGVTYSAKGLDIQCDEVDEYGDMVFTRSYISDQYVRFNIGITVCATSSATALADDFDPVAFGCIVTFNEPIGNGGYVG